MMYQEGNKMAIRIIRKVLKILNRFFMVPMFRLGLGAFVGNPITGYIMVMKTTGWRTGKTRYAPANFAIVDGNVYCMAGFGEGTHWYRNLKANPNLELLLPGRTVAGLAEEIELSAETIPIMRQILKNSGAAGRLAGLNPTSLSDEEVQAKIKDYPLICIRPIGIGSGPADAGGWLWILVFTISIIAILLLFIWH
jgi:hypothetical protein